MAMLELARTIMVAVVEANASRQVVAAVASALLRTGGEQANLDGSGKNAKQTVHQLEVHEQVIATVEEAMGPNIGIGSACRALRDGGFSEVAGAISNMHRSRMMAAHPCGSLPGRVKSAFQAIGQQKSGHEVPLEGGGNVEALQANGPKNLKGGEKVSGVRQHSGLEVPLEGGGVRGDEARAGETTDSTNYLEILEQLKAMQHSTQEGFKVSSDNIGKISEEIRCFEVNKGNDMEEREAVTPLPPRLSGQRVEAADTDMKLKSEYGDPQSS